MILVSTKELFFHLIRYAIGSEENFKYDITEKEWEKLFDICIKQTLAGIAFMGIEKLPEEKRPPKALMLKWHIICEHIKMMNRKLNTYASEVSRRFKDAGFRNVILKGQGIAQLYPSPLYRHPGDIDIWLEGDRDSIVKCLYGIARNITPISYHHIDFPVFKDVPIEVHFTPTWMNDYFNNRKLQRYFKECSDREFCNIQTIAEDKTAPISTIAFNRVFILLHIFRHLFSEGIGLRQMLDYYMVLMQGFTKEEKEKTMQTLNALHLSGFTKATMYVLKKVFGLKEKYMLVTPDAKQGEFLLNEIMISGNFGNYDFRDGNLYDNKLHKRVWGKICHVTRLFKYHPVECICTPQFRVWHYIWRRRKELYYKSDKFIKQ